MAETLALSAIRRDGGTQPRAGLDEPTVAVYAEAYAEGAPFPPVTVFHDGAAHWLADGFHRCAGAARAGLAEIAADIRAGTRRDAVLFAVGANATHGLRRTTEDKRRSVLLLLADEEWAQWSDREIAKRARVSNTFVGSLRALTVNVDSERSFRTKHGTVATMDTAAIGQRAAQVATLRSVPIDVVYEAIGQKHADLARARAEAKAKLRAGREEALAERIEAGNERLAALGREGRRYGVILADPEWRFEPRSRETGMDRAPENHYPTSPTAVIAARPVREIAASDCALFLWATAPMLRDALEVIAGWGFSYKTHAIWLKDRPGRARGPGYWFTGEHEILMLATRGSPPAPAPGAQWPSAFVAPIGPHSAKPARAHELIEAYFPTLPKIELNARTARPGWDVWGAEAPEGLPPAGAVGAPLGRPAPGELRAWGGAA